MNFNELILEIANNLSEKTKLSIILDEILNYHFSLGMFIRNNYIYDNAELQEYFTEKNIHSIDEMSNYIIEKIKEHLKSTYIY